LAVGYQQLADLLRAGVPLLRGLRVLGGRKSTPALSAAFRRLGDAVAQGDDLGKAMAAEPEVFPPIHVAMVRAGERGGFLEGVLTRLAELVAAQADLRAKVVGNLVYPAVLVTFGVLVSAVIFGVFVPMFRPMFERIPGGPPLVTRFVFTASDVVAGYLPVTLGVVAAGVFAGVRLARRPGVARAITGARTRAPLIGPLTRSLAAARFCRMLGTMLANGVPMLGAMQIAKGAAGNVLMEEAITEASEAVRAGKPLAPPLAASGLFDEDVIEMIAVAESANNLDHVLLTVAKTIESRVDRLLNVVVRLIEPALLLLIATVVALVAVALILPMVNLSGRF
jgi:general secretion pathway protein F/type IV pilus assembly protein PilC